VSEPVDPREQFGEHGEWDALAVGWALSALDPEDEGRFADHLPGCDRCTATVRESLHTVADLAYALPDEAPPPALKSRLMAAVAAEPPGAGLPAEPEEPEKWPLGESHRGTPAYGIDWFAELPRPAASRPGQPAGPDRDLDTAVRGEAAGVGLGDPAAAGRGRGLVGPTGAGGRDGEPSAGYGYRGGEDLPRRDADPDRPAGADVVSLASRRRRLGRLIGAGVAAAAVLALIAGLLVSNARLRDQQDDLRRVVAQRDAAIQQLTANGPARVAALTADGQPSPERRATLVVRGDRIEIIVETLGATSGDETYWLWTLRCDTPRPTDLKPIRGFTVAQSEFSVRDIGSDPGVARARCFAISSELGTATPKVPRQVVAVGQPE
jgi:hypothetical protein